ncbi:uncharacterized protein LOC143452090 isoform X2 [Clavelina lepadiformis]|uniref:uncharacterized protein LOC143452090 isoform X2 n=1 Tax=Clavelina lepadiformis TaxID=159417 RepID=UPI0040427351
MDEQGKKLKQWLVDHTNQSRFRLSWDNEERTRIKIPWPKVGDPNFEQNLEVCVAWAKHGETYTEPMTTEKYSQMKKRFADVLRKSRYLKKLDKIERQSGDFVVYELLSRPKNPGKMKKQKRSHPHSSDHPSLNNSFETTLKKVQNPTFPEHGVCGDSEKQMERANNDCVQPHVATNKIHQESFAQQFPTGEPPKISQNLGSCLNVDRNMKSTPQELQMLSQQFQFLHIWPEEELFTFNISVSYKENDHNDYYVPIIEESYEWHEVNLHGGIQLVYSDTSQSTAQLNQSSQAKILNLPQPTMINEQKAFENTIIRIALEKFKDGILLCMNEAYELYATRNCLSCVYYFEDPSVNCGSTKIDQNQRIKLFSLEQYRKNLLHYRGKQRSVKPESKIHIVVGNQPNRITSNCLVRITLEHCLAPAFQEMFGKGDSIPELAISDPNSSESLRSLLRKYGAQIDS